MNYLTSNNIILKSNSRYLQANFTAAYPVNNLIEEFLFDGNYNNTKGNATLTPGSNNSFVSGVVNQAVNVPDSLSYLYTAGSFMNINADSSYSISFWYKRTSTDAGYLIKKIDSSAIGYQLSLDSGNSYKLWFLLDSGNGILSVDSSVSLDTENIWYHIVLTYDGSRNTDGVKIYINNIIGQNGGTNTLKDYTDTTINSDPFYIGFTDGVYDLFRFYDKELTASEVSQLYNSGSGV